MHVAYKRVLLKLSGEVFGGGEVGLDLDVINAIGRRGGRGRQVGRPDRDRRRRWQLLPRRRAPAARHGAGPRRLHGHARHGHELPRAAGLHREARRRDARADRHHDGPGRRALHPAPGHPAHGEGSRRDLRRRRRHAVLLHRHRGRPARAGDALRGDPDGQAGRRRRLRLRPQDQPRRGEVRPAQLRRVPRARPQGRRRDRHRHGPRQQDGHGLLQPLHPGHDRAGGAG